MSELLSSHTLSLIAQAATDAAQPAPNPLMSLLPMLLLFAGFWFLIISPQRKKQKEHERMVTELKTGAEVVTAGGIYGTIANVKDDRFVVKVADGVKIEVTKNSIGTCLNKDDAKK